ncbi:MAG: PqqD family protein [Candidatus Melainabacteria bacterium]|nr:PqqD family protein [Candidatus Melainabacteria bacterium]
MKSTISERSIFMPSKEQVSCDLAGEAVILNFKDGIYYGLDAIGASVWELIQKSKTVKEIRDSILENYDVEPDHCKNDLIALLNDLKTIGLIEIKNETLK